MSDERFQSILTLIATVAVASIPLVHLWLAARIAARAKAAADELAEKAAKRLAEELRKADDDH